MRSRPSYKKHDQDPKCIYLDKRFGSVARGAAWFMDGIHHNSKAMPAMASIYSFHALS